jgi:hypothetical protein
MARKQRMQVNGDAQPPRIALQEIYRALSPTHAEQVARALQARAAQLPPLRGAADAAAAGELAALLSAQKA